MRNGSASDHPPRFQQVDDGVDGTEGTDEARASDAGDDRAPLPLAQGSESGGDAVSLSGSITQALGDYSDGLPEFELHPAKHFQSSEENGDWIVLIHGGLDADMVGRIIYQVAANQGRHDFTAEIGGLGDLAGRANHSDCFSIRFRMK